MSGKGWVLIGSLASKAPANTGTQLKIVVCFRLPAYDGLTNRKAGNCELIISYDRVTEIDASHEPARQVGFKHTACVQSEIRPPTKSEESEFKCPVAEKRGLCSDKIIDPGEANQTRAGFAEGSEVSPAVTGLYPELILQQPATATEDALVTRIKVRGGFDGDALVKIISEPASQTRFRIDALRPKEHYITRNRRWRIERK